MLCSDCNTEDWGRRWRCIWGSFVKQNHTRSLLDILLNPSKLPCDLQTKRTDMVSWSPYSILYKFIQLCRILYYMYSILWIALCSIFEPAKLSCDLQTKWTDMVSWSFYTIVSLYSCWAFCNIFTTFYWFQKQNHAGSLLDIGWTCEACMWLTNEVSTYGLLI